MKNFPFRRHHFALVVICLIAALVQPAFAQTPEATADEWHEVHLKYAKPHLVAYWIDPEHNPMPKEYKPVSEFMNEYFMKRNTLSSLKRIDKVSSAVRESNYHTTKTDPEPLKVLSVPDDTQQVVWVRATPAAFKQVESIIASVDRPTRNIKITAKVIQLRSAGLLTDDKSAFINKIFSPTKIISFGGYSEKVQSQLDELVAQGKVNIIKDQQLMIPNNLTDSIAQTSSTPATIDIKTANNTVKVKSGDDNQLFLEKRFALMFTPTINNDDSITVFMTLAANAMLTHQRSSTPNDHLWIESLSKEPPRTAVFTVHNGDTVLVIGLNSTKLGLDNKNLPTALLMKGEIVE